MSAPALSLDTDQIAEHNAWLETQTAEQRVAWALKHGPATKASAIGRIRAWLRGSRQVPIIGTMVLASIRRQATRAPPAMIDSAMIHSVSAAILRILI